MRQISLLILLLLCYFEVLAQSDCDFSGLQHEALNTLATTAVTYDRTFQVEALDVDIICDGPSQLTVQLLLQANQTAFARLRLKDARGSAVNYLRNPEVVQLQSGVAVNLSFTLKAGADIDQMTTRLEVRLANSPHAFNVPMALTFQYAAVKRWCKRKDGNCRNERLKVATTPVALFANGRYPFERLKMPLPEFTRSPGTAPPEGPGETFLDLDALVDPDQRVSLSEVLGIDRRLHYDRNGDSTIFYWQARSFRLARKPDGTFDLRQVPRGQGGRIDLSARLTAGVYPGIDSLLTHLLGSYFGKTVEVFPLPLSGPMRFRHDWEAAYGATASFTPSSNELTAELLVDITTDREGLAAITLGLLQRNGLNAEALLSLKRNSEPAEIALPVSIQLRGNDHRIIEAGTMQNGHKRGRFYYNSSCIPLELQRLGMLVMLPPSTGYPAPEIWSWRLRSTPGQPVTLPGKGSAYFQLDENVNSLLAVNPYTLLRWVEASSGDLGACGGEMLTAMLSAGLPAERALTVEVMPGLFSLTEQLASITVECRSRYFEPHSASLEVKTITLFPSSSVAQVCSIYGDMAVGDPPYDYKIRLTTVRGKEFTSSWLPGENPTLLLGPGPLRRSFPGFPW